MMRREVRSVKSKLNKHFIKHTNVSPYWWTLIFLFGHVKCVLFIVVFPFGVHTAPAPAFHSPPPRCCSTMLRWEWESAAESPGPWSVGSSRWGQDGRRGGDREEEEEEEEQRLSGKMRRCDCLCHRVEKCQVRFSSSTTWLRSPPPARPSLSCSVRDPQGPHVRGLRMGKVSPTA